MSYDLSQSNGFATGSGDVVLPAPFVPGVSLSWSFEWLLGASGHIQAFGPEDDHVLPEMVEETTVPPASHNHTSSQGRRRELEWRQTHREELRQYAGEYVALEGEEIIAHDPDPLVVVAEARSRGIRGPYIFRIGESTGGSPVTLEWD